MESPTVNTENIKRADINLIASNLGLTPRYVSYVLRGERDVKSRMAKNIIKAFEILKEGEEAIRNLSKNHETEAE